MPLIAADLQVHREPGSRRMPYPTDTAGYLDASYNDICAVLGEAVVPAPGGGVEWVIETPAGQAILFDRENPFDPQHQCNRSADWHVWAYDSAVLPWIHRVIIGGPQSFPSCLAPSTTPEQLLMSYLYYLHHRAAALPTGGVLATQLILQRNDMIEALIRHEHGAGILAELPEPSPAAGTRLHRATVALRETLETTRRRQDCEAQHPWPALGDHVTTESILTAKAGDTTWLAIMSECGLTPDKAESAAHTATLKAMATALTRPPLSD